MGYQDYLAADAHGVYDDLYADEAIAEVDCWANAPRPFLKAMSLDTHRARWRWR